MNKINLIIKKIIISLFLIGLICINIFLKDNIIENSMKNIDANNYLLYSYTKNNISIENIFCYNIQNIDTNVYKITGTFNQITPVNEYVVKNINVTFNIKSIETEIISNYYSDNGNQYKTSSFLYSNNIKQLNYEFQNNYAYFEIIIYDENFNNNNFNINISYDVYGKYYNIFNRFHNIHYDIKAN